MYDPYVYMSLINIDAMDLSEDPSLPVEKLPEPILSNRFSNRYLRGPWSSYREGNALMLLLFITESLSLCLYKRVARESRLKTRSLRVTTPYDNFLIKVMKYGMLIVDTKTNQDVCFIFGAFPCCFA